MHIKSEEKNIFIISMLLESQCYIFCTTNNFIFFQTGKFGRFMELTFVFTKLTITTLMQVKGSSMYKSVNTIFDKLSK